MAFSGSTATGGEETRYLGTDRRGGGEACPIGVRLDCGVTMHGFALNIDLIYLPFPYCACGLDDAG